MLNLCVIAGNLGNDPEVRYTSDGKPIAQFNLAFSSGKDNTGWIRIVCFNKLAQVCEEHLHKGARIALCGTLEEDRWKTDSGQDRSRFQIIARSIEFIQTNRERSR